MLRFALQGLYAVPLTNPTSILDVGTGTGRWALDMAQLFPRANVIGLDVNPPPAAPYHVQHWRTHDYWLPYPDGWACGRAAAAPVVERERQRHAARAWRISPSTTTLPLALS